PLAHEHVQGGGGAGDGDPLPHRPRAHDPDGADGGHGASTNSAPSRPMRRNFSYRPSSSDSRGRADSSASCASRIASRDRKSASGSTWAPPTGSRTTSSTMPKRARSAAVIFMAVAASSARPLSRQR